MAMTVENGVLGMGTDYVAFDPYEPGITEFLDEAGVLYAEFREPDLNNIRIRGL